jgi:hypothetical protein
MFWRRQDSKCISQNWGEKGGKKIKLKKELKKYEHNRVAT